MPERTWLPALIRLVDSGNDWTVYLDVVYLMFKKDFVETTPVFEGNAVRLKRHPMKDGREATFWHLISEGFDEKSRVPHEMRCERIRWPKPVIERVPCTELKRWESKRGGETRVVIAFHDYSYVVVLAKRSGYFLPWTAYPVERNHRRAKLRKECEEYERKNTGAAS